jgi:hypothetical protein
VRNGLFLVLALEACSDLEPGGPGDSTGEARPVTVGGVTSSLTKVVRDVARDFAAEGRPLPVPPDRVDADTENALDRGFWDEVDRRMAELERLERGWRVIAPAPFVVSDSL